MSDSVRPQRRQPTRLPHPWDSPGKNTGVGCHVLLQCGKVKSESEVIQSCPTLCDPMDCSPPGSSVHGIFQARVLEWGAPSLKQELLCSPVYMDHHVITLVRERGWKVFLTLILAPLAPSPCSHPAPPGIWLVVCASIILENLLEALPALCAWTFPSRASRGQPEHWLLWPLLLPRPGWHKEALVGSLS